MEEGVEKDSLCITGGAGVGHEFKSPPCKWMLYFGMMWQLEVYGRINILGEPLCSLLVIQLSWALSSEELT